MACDGALREGVLYDLALGRHQHEDVQSALSKSLMERSHVIMRTCTKVEGKAFEARTSGWKRGNSMKNGTAICSVGQRACMRSGHCSLPLP